MPGKRGEEAEIMLLRYKFASFWRKQPDNNRVVGFRTVDRIFCKESPVMMTDVPDERLGARLLNEWQQDFPLCPAPFAELGRQARRRRDGGTAHALSSACGARPYRPCRRGVRLKRIGASSLAAMAVPADKFARWPRRSIAFPRSIRTMSGSIPTISGLSSPPVRRDGYRPHSARSNRRRACRCCACRW